MKNKNQRDFYHLVETIQNISAEFAKHASRSVNINLTLRNWCIGGYIHEYELGGSDRAHYGDKLLEELAKSLHRVSNCNKRQLYRYLRLYRFYPEIVMAVSGKLKSLLPSSVNITQKKIVGTASPQLKISAEKLVQNLSYSHFDLIVDIDDETKRIFYEIEAVRGNWSVRELKRQINSLYYERSALSLNKEKLSELAQQGAQQQNPILSIRDPYKHIIGEQIHKDEVFKEIFEQAENFKKHRTD